MKYIISADLWLTAGIGQQPHLLKKQRQHRQQYHKLELAQKLALGVESRWGMWLCGTREGEGGGEGHTPAHRAFGKLHALAHAHAHAIAHIHGHVACHGTPIWPKHAHTNTHTNAHQHVHMARLRARTRRMLAQSSSSHDADARSVRVFVAFAVCSSTRKY